MLRDNQGRFESKGKRLMKITGYIWIAVFVMAGINYIVGSAVRYHTSHNYGLRSPLVVEVNTQSVFWSESKPEPEIISPLADVEEIEVVNAVVTPEWYQDLSDLERKVCDLWGEYDCKNAVARCRAESGCQQVDEKGRTKYSPTADVGAMQINEVHYTYTSPSYKPECDLKEIVTEDGNLNCAMSIYKASGWNAWSTTHNGSADAELSAMR